MFIKDRRLPLARRSLGEGGNRREGDLETEPH
jgi:hypothetical protein